VTEIGLLTKEIG